MLKKSLITLLLCFIMSGSAFAVDLVNTLGSCVGGGSGLTVANWNGQKVLFRFVWKVGSYRHRILEGVSRQV